MVKRTRRRKRRRKRHVQRGGACGCPKVIDHSPLPTPPWLPPGRMYEPGGINGLTDGYYYGVEVSQALPDPINQTNLGQMKGGRRTRRRSRGGRKRLADSVFDSVMGFPEHKRREHKRKPKSAVAHMKDAFKGLQGTGKKIGDALKRGHFGIKEEVQARVSWKGAGRKSRRRTRRRRRRRRRTRRRRTRR